LGWYFINLQLRLSRLLYVLCRWQKIGKYAFVTLVYHVSTLQQMSTLFKSAEVYFSKDTISFISIHIRTNRHRNAYLINHLHWIIIGTYPYIAPEVYNCERFVPQSDVYAIGIILWEMANRCIKGKYEKPYGEYKQFEFEFQILIQVRFVCIFHFEYIYFFVQLLTYSHSRCWFAHTHTHLLTFILFSFFTYFHSCLFYSPFLYCSFCARSLTHSLSLSMFRLVWWICVQRFHHNVLLNLPTSLNR
jgi:serine/threonine protein kinase